MSKAKKELSDRKREADKRRELEMEELRLLEERKRHQIQFELPLNKSSNDKEEKTLEQGHQALIKAYKEQFNIEPEIGKNGHTTLSFKNEQEAHQFFEDMAKQNHKFIALEVDKNGNYTGQYYMSLGDGQLIEGKIAPSEIDSLKENFHKGIHATKSEEKEAARRALTNPKEVNRTDTFWKPAKEEKEVGKPEHTRSHKVK